MKEELDEALCRDFPNLFANRNASPSESCFAFGFECGSGWEPLIRELASKIEPLIVKMKQEEPNLDYYPTVDQVKEKYGTLRFYMSVETEEMSKFISEAENKSAVTCETCGNRGKLRGRGWYYTACDEHTGEKDRVV